MKRTYSETLVMTSIHNLVWAGFRQIEQLASAVTQPIERWISRGGSITPLVIATLIAYLYLVLRPKN